MVSNSGIDTVRDLIDRMAASQPDRAFLLGPETGQVITFKGLQERVNRLCGLFQQMGLQCGDKVAFLMDNGLFTAQFFLGTMYGGYVSVPLNVRAGVSQLSYTLDHSDAKAVFVERQYDALINEVLAGVGRPVEVVSADVGDCPAEFGAPLTGRALSPVRAEDAALLMYTSGSTGQPKGALHTHRSVLAHGRNSINAHQLTSADRSLLVLPLYHINAECVTLIPTLLSGGSVVVPKGFAVGEFWNWMDDYQCTWSALVPTIISQLLDWRDPKAENRTAAFQRIRFLRSSSAPLSPSLHREFIDKFNLPLIQAMGSSEAGNVFSNPVPPGTNKIGSPGLPWGFETKIINHNGAELPAGEPGEVLLRGNGMMQGYYKDPNGTGAALDAEGWLHTGDLAYRDEDGYFFVIGRSKELIIKGGVNIAPRQIDEVLESHPAVFEAAAVGVPDRYFGEDVIAFVVLRSDTAADERELLTFCEARLGHFKTPSRIHLLKELPKGPSGKVQRLRLLDHAVLSTVAAAVQPEHVVSMSRNSPASDDSFTTSSVAQIISAIWAEALALPQVDPDTNFFALGGHSLLAIQCLSKLRQKLPIVLSLADFFECGTVTEQAELVHQRLGAASGANVSGGPDSAASLEQSLLQQLIPRKDLSAPHPLSPAQQGLWFLEQLNPNVPVYNEAEAVRLTGELNVDALERAMNMIVDRHEVLRSSIKIIDEMPHAIIHDSWPIRFKRIDLSTLPRVQRDAEVDRLLIDEPRIPYNLEAAPGIRISLLHLSPQEHVLILMMHHIICDWASEGVIWRELSALYRSLLTGEPATLPELPVKHGDYAVWQHQKLATTHVAEDLDFWEKTLHGAPALLELPADRPRPPIMSYQGDRIRWKLNNDLTDALRNISRNEKASLFSVFAAALDTLLYRYTGNDDILVGIPLADRDHTELQNIVGYLLRMHVLRTRLSGEMTFRELLSLVQKSALDLYTHRGVPFDQIVQKLQTERTLSYTPVFQVALNWRDRDQMLSVIGLDGLAVDSLMATAATSKFDLLLQATDMGDEIWLELEYNTDLFDRDRMTRMLGHYQTLLSAVAVNTGVCLAQIPLLTASEHHQLLYAWNTTRADFPQDKCIHELFEEQAAKSPDAIAIVFEDQQLGYAELNRRANQLAHHLRTLGVEPDARVAICLERGCEMIVGLLAILKAGGAYVPLDPAYPAERLRFMLQDSQPVVLLTQGHLRDLLPELSATLPVLDLEQRGGAWQEKADTNPDPRDIGLTAQHLAYIIYTSGSTGRPKGVAVEHRNLENLVHWHCHAFALQRGQHVSSVAGFGFDAATWEIWPPLCMGATLALPTSATCHDPEALLAWWSSQDLDRSFLPTPIAEFAFAQKIINPRLKDLLIGGDRLRHMPHHTLPFSLVNNYGPTETTVVATSGRIATTASILSIGRPIANTQIYILDAYGNPVPIGVAGELYIGGAGVARGYLNRPELTAERFLPDPFSADPAARMYRTGDVGRWLADGNIEFLGRNDNQVKLRGFRIELGEIEARLLEHAAIRQAVVIAREDVPGDKRLVAYYIALNHEPIDPEQLRSHLAAALPEYMVPAAYMRLGALPLTPNGKLDRKALPVPEADAYISRRYEAPQGQTEILLAEIWAEVLKLDRVGRHDNFFDLGGHSLLAISLIERMRRVGMQVSVRTLFTAPTLTDVAASVGNEAVVVDVPPNKIPERCSFITPAMLPLVQMTQHQIDGIVARVPGGSANVQDIYPLAPLQEGLFFHHLMRTEGDPYLLASLFSLDSRSRLNGYVQAIQAVVDRHDILRTAMHWEGLPEPVQVVWRSAPVHIEEIALDPEQGDAAEQLYARFNPRQFAIDMHQAPLLRLYIAFDITQKRWLLMQLFHHIIVDHTSLRTMQAELQAHFLGQEASLPAPLPFRNLVAQTRFGVSQQDHEAFFRNMLADIDEPTTPFGLLDVQGDGSNIEEFRVRLDADLAHRLRVNARRLGVSAASLCHLAWARVLAEVSGRDDVVFGTVLFGRMHGDASADRAMGVFINTLPVRISIGDVGVEASVRKTHAVLAELLRHEHASLALAQRCSAVPAPAPLFSVILNFRHSAAPDRTPSRETLRAWEGIHRLRIEERTNYPFVLSVEDLGEGFELTAQTRALIGPARVCAFMQTALDSLVQALEHAPATAVRALPVLPASERHQLLYAWNATQADFPRDKCVHELFEEQVAKSPDAIAVVFEDEQLSYAELNRRANLLAHLLIERGVKPDGRVVVLLERSIDLIVTQLAILKAGGAYVPLDPHAPAMRHAWIMADCAACLIITDACTEFFFTPVVPVLRLKADGIDAAEGSATNPERVGFSLRVAYVMYTSGSTGAPKGVLVPHRAIVRLVINNGYAVIGANDRVAFAANPAFDASTFEVWAPLLNGGMVVVIRHETVLTPQAFIRTLQEKRINVLWLTVGLFNQLAEALEPVFAQFKVVITGGDALDPRVMARVWSNPLKRPQQLLNGYGPTETTTFATTYRIGSLQDESLSIPIGRPISNTRIYLLDARGEPVPLGAVGEVYIGGAGVALGYLNRPELSAERFLVDPFSGDPDERMYRTGDLARYLPDGNLMFIGRNDNQVKLRGFRIELGEIEARLLEHAAIRQAVVIAREDVPGDKRLVAYYIALNHEPIDPEQLRSHLAAALPEYMVPAAYMRLGALPLTPNGKLDRKALPVPEADAYISRRYEAPQGQTEILLAEIWAEVLKLDRVGRHDNFFDLGGHSLLAVRVIGDINRTLRARLTVPTFYKDPTIEGVAKVLEQTDGARPKVQLIRLQSGHTGLPLYLIGARPLEHRIAQFIGEDRAVFAIDLPIPVEWHQTIAAADRTALPTFEELGALYGDVLCAHAGSSPCVVGGYCFAGKVAFEAARVLQRAGGNVASVLLIDAQAGYVGDGPTRANLKRSLRWIWKSAVTETANDGHFLNATTALLGNCWRLLRWLRGRTPNAVRRRIDKVKNGSSPVARPSGYFDKEGMPIDETVLGQLNYFAGRSWNPRPLDASGTLIRAKFPGEQILPGYDFAKGWSKLFVHGLEIVEAAGDHISMLGDENIGALAQQINAVLDQRQDVPTSGRVGLDDNSDADFSPSQLTKVPQLDSAD